LLAIHTHTLEFTGKFDRQDCRPGNGKAMKSFRGSGLTFSQKPPLQSASKAFPVQAPMQPGALSGVTVNLWGVFHGIPGDLNRERPGKLAIFEDLRYQILN
jgi:hypothetical protein